MALASNSVRGVAFTADGSPSWLRLEDSPEHTAHPGGDTNATIFDHFAVKSQRTLKPTSPENNELFDAFDDELLDLLSAGVAESYSRCRSELLTFDG